MLVSVHFFFNDTATTEIYTYLHTLSLHDALAIWFFITPTDGSSVWNLTDDTQYRWDAGASPAGWDAVSAGEANTIDSDPSGVSGADQITNVMKIGRAHV